MKTKRTLTALALATVMTTSCVTQRTVYCPQKERPQVSYNQRANDRTRKIITWATIGALIGFVVTH